MLEIIFISNFKTIVNITSNHLNHLQAAGNIMYKSLSNTTLSFSNVAGPAEEVSFFGHPMVFFAPSLYGFPQVCTIEQFSFQILFFKPSLIKILFDLAHIACRPW